MSIQEQQLLCMKEMSCKSEISRLEFSVGVDLENVSRFRKHGLKETSFWGNILTEKEISRLKKYRDPFPHAAGIFCAKEAIRKALSPLGIRLSFVSLEVRHRGDGSPEIQILKSNSIDCIIRCRASISHTNGMAVAAVVCVLCRKSDREVSRINARTPQFPKPKNHARDRYQS